MKKTFIITAATVALVCGCAKDRPEVANEDAQRYYDAWISVNQNRYNLSPFGDNGSYLFGEETTGDGKEIADSSYIFVHYTIRDLSGSISSSSRREVAQQLGSYSETKAYGPAIWTKSSLNAGVEELLTGMKMSVEESADATEGNGWRKAVIPGWMFTSQRYDSKQGYLDNVTGGTNAIYEVETVFGCNDIIKWQIDNIEKYIKDGNGLVQNHLDTAKTGYGLYIDMKGADIIAEKDTVKFSSDTTFYINYTGRRLDGQVFDTTIERVAKDNMIYSSSNTYEPVKIIWEESHDAISMGTSGSTLISGFSQLLWNMQYGIKTWDNAGKPYKAVAVFTSGLGYGASGSGTNISPYCPLIFEVEIIKEEQEED